MWPVLRYPGQTLPGLAWLSICLILYLPFCFSVTVGLTDLKSDFNSVYFTRSWIKSFPIAIDLSGASAHLSYRVSPFVFLKSDITWYHRNFGALINLAIRLGQKHSLKALIVRCTRANGRPPNVFRITAGPIETIFKFSTWTIAYNKL